MQDYRNLRVWQKAHELALATYSISACLQKPEAWPLRDQALRAAISIPSNIAEGAGRGTDPDFRRFLWHSLGSCNELEYDLLLARDLRFLSSEQHAPLRQQLEDVRRMLTGLVQRLTPSDTVALRPEREAEAGSRKQEAGDYPMKVYDAQGIRNVALVGHSGAGKTQLVSALLFDAGAVNRLGRVDDGTTVTDYDEEEIARKHTLACSLAYLEWNKHKINLIDTPGMANFLSDARAALRVADAALVVVDGVHGVEVSTEKVWAAAEDLQLPRIIVLNRLDRERASLERSIESLRNRFGRAVVPLQLPIGEDRGFRGVVDLVAMKAWTFADDESGKPSQGDIPGVLLEPAQAAREALIEMVAEADDELMEKFFDAGTLTQDELVGGLKRAIAAARIFPVLCASATANAGMQPLLDALIAYVPSPAERPLRAVDARTEDQIAVEPIEHAPASAFIWKTVADPFAGRITMFRVVTGSLKTDSTVQNVTRNTTERLGHLVLLQGKPRRPCPRSRPGTSEPSRSSRRARRTTCLRTSRWPSRSLRSRSRRR